MRPGLAWLAALAIAGLVPAIASADTDTVPPTASTAPLDPEWLKIAEEIIAISYPVEKRAAMYSGMMDAMADQMRAPVLDRFNDRGLRQIVDSYMNGMTARNMPIVERHLPSLMDSYARGYAQEFSLAELLEIRSFVHTPAGARFLMRNAGLLKNADVASANQAFISDIMKAMPAEQQALKDQITTYLAKHPEVAKKVSGW